MEITLLYLDKFSTPSKSRTTKFTLKIFCPIYNNFSPEERNYRLTGFNRSPSKRLQFILIYIGCDDIRAPIRSRSTHVARTIITSGLSKGDAEQQPRQHYHRTGVSVDETPAGLSSPSWRPMKERRKRCGDGWILGYATITSVAPLEFATERCRFSERRESFL